jgi:hypothetical protein
MGRKDVVRGESPTRPVDQHVSHAGQISAMLRLSVTILYGAAYHLAPDLGFY